MINTELAKQRNLSEETIAAIEKLHEERDAIHAEIIANKDKPSLLKDIAEPLEGIEERLQELWGFKKNLNYYKFWEVPCCSCPKMDNDDNYPIGFYYKSVGCPIHGYRFFAQ